MSKIYALVIDGQISIYPLTQEQIKERNAPFEDYYDVFYNQKPNYDHLTQYLVETPVVIATYVLINYDIKHKTIEHLLESNIPLHGKLTYVRGPVTLSSGEKLFLAANTDDIVYRIYGYDNRRL